MTDKTGGPAFPCDNIYTGNGNFHNAEGMTLRDYFAAKAMPSVISDWLSTGDIPDPEIAEVIARDCYMVADAMLKAREQ